jgi:hypothetical protein
MLMGIGNCCGWLPLSGSPIGLARGAVVKTCPSPSMVLLPGGVSSRGGSLLASKGTVVLTTLVNTGAKIPCVLVVEGLLSYACECPNSP